MNTNFSWASHDLIYNESIPSASSMTKLLFTSSYELLFGPIVVRVSVSNRAFLEGDKQDITKVAFLA